MISLMEEEEGSPFKEELLHSKHSELKEKLHSINQGFERLRRVSHQGYDPTSGTVPSLWHLVGKVGKHLGPATGYGEQGFSLGGWMEKGVGRAGQGSFLSGNFS